MAAAIPALEIRDLHKRYGELEVLKGISLTARDGDVISILGSSGSGKSTFLRCINLLENPHQGQILVAGEELKLKAAKNGDLVAADNKQINRLRSEIGFVFQNFNLVPVLSALENVMLPLQIQGVSERSARERARAALVDVGLERFREARPDKLSGGQRQRVAIARALVVDPALVIADEPTANLDSENSRMVVDLMREMNREHKVTFVFTTHDPRLLDHVDRRILLRDGSIERDEQMEALEAA